MGMMQLGDMLQKPEATPSLSAESGFHHPSLTRKLPTPDLPLEEIFLRLRHPEDVRRFLETHTKHRTPEDVFEFLSTYRLSPEEFLKLGEGPCSCYSEFWCRWLASRGGTPYIGRLMEKEQEGKDWDWKNCHEMTVMQIAEGRFLVMSNSQYYDMKTSTAEEAMHTICPDQEMPSFGGIVPWTQTKDRWLSRMIYTARPNMPELTQNPHIFQTPKIAQRRIRLFPDLLARPIRIG